MSSWAILLRVLLSLFLVLNNGATSAAAAAHMQMNHVAAQTAIEAPVAVSPASAEDMPCHHHDQASVAAAHNDPPIAADPAPEKSKHPSPDCCKSSTCRCACMHVAQATLPALNMATPALDHNRSVRRLTLAHAAPALPHLIRPPIG